MPKAFEMPFFVRLIGGCPSDKGDRGAVKGFALKEDAETDAAERDERAIGWGLKARYEVVAS